MSAVDLFRDALYGSPPSPTYQPSKEGMLAAFTELADANGTGGGTGGVTISPVPGGFGHRFNTSSGDGYALSQFGVDENYYQLWYFGEGGDFRTRKFMIISGVTDDTDSSPGGIAARMLTNYRSKIYGSSWQPSMLQLWSDVNGATIQVRQSYDPSIAMSFVSRIGEENFAIRGNLGGELSWPIRGTEPIVDDHINEPAMNGGFGALTADDHQIRLRSFADGADIDGLLIYHKDGGATGSGGAVSYVLGPNCSIAGVQNGVDGAGIPNGIARNIVQNEGGVSRWGNATFNSTYNANAQHVFEIAGVNQAYLTTAGFLPLVNASKNLGSAGLQWNNIFLVNAPTVSSDQRLKQDIGDIPESWLRAWALVKPRRYKMKAAVEIKGDAARWHVGYIAQEIVAAFAEVDLDATEIGIVCFDKWDDEFQDEIAEVEVPERVVTETKLVPSKILGANGRPIMRNKKVKRTIAATRTRQPTGNKILVRAAGEQWSVRYEECAVLESALARSMRGAQS